MTLDELFLLTTDDLQERVGLGRGEYDALMSAWLIRKLIVDSPSLLSRVNRSRRVKLVFRVNGIQPPPTISGWSPGEFLDPVAASATTVVELTLARFLAYPTIVAFGHTISVKYLVKFMANIEGAVHISPLNDTKSSALAAHRWAESRSDPRGQYGGCIHELVAIGRILLAATSDLRQRIEDEIWPGGISHHARGLRRPAKPGLIQGSGSGLTPTINP